jgi:hypothetical protein
MSHNSSYQEKVTKVYNKWDLAIAFFPGQHWSLSPTRGYDGFLQQPIFSGRPERGIFGTTNDHAGLTCHKLFIKNKNSLKTIHAVFSD